MNETAGSDTHVRIPRQVREQALRAENLLKPGSSEPVPQPPQDPPAPAAAAPVPSFTVEELLTAPSPEKNASRDYWHQRANVIEGIRRREKLTADQRAEALQGQIQKLEQKLLEAKNAAPVAQPVLDVKKEFTPEDIELFGEERCMVMLRERQRAVQEASAQIESKFRAELDAQKAKNDDKAQQEANERHQKFLDALTGFVPTWQVVNKDPQWLEWLAQDDPQTGIPRQQLLNEHQRRGNARNVANLFDAFFKSLGSVPTPPPAAVPVADGAGGAQGSASPAPAAEGRLTDAQIREGYKNIATGRLKGEEAKRFEARVNAQLGTR